MSSFLLGIAIFIALLTAAALYRVAVGRTIFDRIIAAGLVGTNGFILLVLIGFIFGPRYRLRTFELRYRNRAGEIL